MTADALTADALIADALATDAPTTDAVTADALTTDPVPDARAARTVWTAVCRVADLAPERGAAALVDGRQVALFRLVDDTVLAVDQRDPFSGAHVISRGIVGTRGDVPTVASPMYKQVFDLRTGRCLDGVGREPQDLRAWPVRVEGDVVLVGALREHGARPGDGGAR